MATSVWIHRVLSACLAALVAGSALVASAQQTYRRPVACSSCIANWYYFDQNPAVGARDWSCASSSYDGHRGSDFSLAGGNGAIDAGHDVVAGASGTVVSALDGFFDRCTGCPAAGADPSCGLGFGAGFGNHVVIQHGTDRVVYAHMRSGSIRVAVGDAVACGQVIGQIGSSGCSTGAHVHFEVRSGSFGSTAFDPFAGTCSATSPSRWTSQGPHRGLPGADCPVCPAGSTPAWTCAGSVRSRCVDGASASEDCAPGLCETRPAGTDHVCDRDGDGYAGDEGDCDDARASVHPGAVEVCANSLDDDCVGGDAPCAPDAGLDAGAPDAWAAPDAAGCPPGLDARWRCEDTSKRSRCTPELGLMTDICAPGLCESRTMGDHVCDRDGDGYAPDEGDCMDTEASVHPGAVEVCSNMLDDDCVGGDDSCMSDAGPASLDTSPDTGVFADASGCSGAWEAHWSCEGDRRRRCLGAAAMYETCAPGVCESRPPDADAACDRDSDGYATDELDCDDRDDRVHPGAEEVCGNLLDDDCVDGDAVCVRDAAPPLPLDAAMSVATDAATIDAPVEHDAAATSLDAGGGIDATAPVVDAAGSDDAPTAPTSTAGCACIVGAAAPRPGLAMLLAMLLAAGARRSPPSGRCPARRKVGARIGGP